MIKKVTFLFTAVLVAGFITFVMYMQGPAQGILNQPSVEANNTQKVAMDKFRTEGDHLSFACSSEYTLTRHSIRSSSESLSLKKSSLLQSSLLVSYTAISSKKLAVSVEPLQSGNLSHSASYAFRVSSPKLYTEGVKDIAGEKVAFFARDEGMTERTVFLRHDGLVATVSLSASGGDSKALEDEVSEVAKSIRWKQ